MAELACAPNSTVAGTMRKLWCVGLSPDFGAHIFIKYFNCNLKIVDHERD